MPKVSEFFGRHQQKFLSFANRNEAAASIESEAPNGYKLLNEFLQVTSKRPGNYDDFCRSTISIIGNQFIDEIGHSDHNIDSLMCFAARCAKEYMLRSPFEVPETLKETIKYFEDFDGDPNYRNENLYLSHKHVSIVLSDIVNEQLEQSDELQQKLNQEAQETEQKISDWQDFIGGQVQYIERQRKYIDTLQADFNFVGLSKAFSDILDEKKRESIRGLFSMLVLGVALLVPLLYLAIERPFVPFNWQELPAYLPLIGVELLLFYFFRVTLLNYQSVRAQILQLRLRSSLCAFIQGYSEFASKMDGHSLERFEAQIFSGLVTDPDSIPSTFDGVDQIAKMLKTIKDAS